MLGAMHFSRIDLIVINKRQKTHYIQNTLFTLNKGKKDIIQTVLIKVKRV